MEDIFVMLVAGAIIFGLLALLEVLVRKERKSQDDRWNSFILEFERVNCNLKRIADYWDIYTDVLCEQEMKEHKEFNRDGL